MASSQQNKRSSKNTFAETIHTIAGRFPLFTVFDDFLTMSIAACTQNVHTKKSWYEDEYLDTIAKYKDSDLRFEFSKAFACLILEMEERVDSSHGNDVLGEFFEHYISKGRNGQFFTPYPICKFMSSITFAKGDETTDEPPRPLRILDLACGSGRMVIASYREVGAGHEYYGIDIDRTCVKVTALNLFLNGVWGSEVLCANALLPNDFVIAYRISLVPFGIFRIEVKEHSRLWVLHQQSFDVTKPKQAGADIVLDPTPFNERPKDDSQQLDLF